MKDENEKLDESWLIYITGAENWKWSMKLLTNVSQKYENIKVSAALPINALELI